MAGSTFTINSTQGDRLYKNQAAVIVMNLNRDISTADTHKMIIVNPYGYSTEVTSTYNTTDGTIKKNFSTGYFDVAGQWILKAFDEGEQITGENYYLYVNERWRR